MKNIKFVDVHLHLDHEKFDEDRDDVVKRAEQKGATAIITSGINPHNNKEILMLAREYDLVKASFGMYPLGNFNVDHQQSCAWIEQHRSECVAIGEIGLDYNEGRETEQQQKEIFKQYLQLAKKLDLPVIIHSRKAESDCLDILEEEEMKQVVMHCFSAKKALIRRGVTLGYYFSVPPVITRLDHFKTLVELVPLKQLLTETDAPYLSPIYATRNEPANTPLTIKEIARIKNLNEEEAAREMFNNAKTLFKLR